MNITKDTTTDSYDNIILKMNSTNNCFDVHSDTFSVNL